MALSLSVLLWFSGLRDSLERPSVVGSLDIRQLELSVLAAEALPPSWGPLLVGDDPRGLLRDTLEEHLRESSSPLPVAQRLTLAPPLARPLCALSPALYTVFNALPWLRTHVLAWVHKPLD